MIYLPFGGQGITYGSGHWYYSATWWEFHPKQLPYRLWREGYLYKYDEEFRPLGHNYFPYREEYDHIGGLQFWNGNIWAALEDVTYTRPRVAIFKEDLSADLCVDLPHQRGCPWVTLDEGGQLYSSEFDPCDTILVYWPSLPEATLLQEIPLSHTLHNVQGGCWYRGSLYLSCDDEGKGIYRVSERGEVHHLVDTGIDTEMEDLHVMNWKAYFIDHQGVMRSIPL